MPLIQEYVVEARVELIIKRGDGETIIEEIAVNDFGNASSYLGTSLEKRALDLLLHLKARAMNHVQATTSNERARLDLNAH